MKAMHLPLAVAAAASLVLSSCEENGMNQDTATAELSSLAALVDGSLSTGRNYFSGQCGPLTVKYFAATQVSLTKGSPANDGARDAAWFGTASLRAEDAARVNSVEYLQSRGEGTFGMQGRQRDVSGQWRDMRTPLPEPILDRDMNLRWLALDLSRAHQGAPFTWAYLANVIASEAKPGEYQFRPLQPEVFRINGTETCEIMPGWATITITP